MDFELVEFRRGTVEGSRGFQGGQRRGDAPGDATAKAEANHPQPFAINIVERLQVVGRGEEIAHMAVGAGVGQQRGYGIAIMGSRATFA